MMTRRKILGASVALVALIPACSLTPSQVAADADALYNAAIEAVNVLAANGKVIPFQVNQDLALLKDITDKIGANVTTFDVNGYITAAEDVIGMLGPIALGVPGLEPVGLALSAINVLLPVIVAVFGGAVRAAPTTLAATRKLPPMDLATARTRYRSKK